jgi:uncharacterized protein with PQ loop repeat
MLQEFLLNHIASIAGIILGICYLPQIYITYKTKNVEGMALSFWILLNIALSCLVVNSIVVYQLTGAYGYMITEFFNEGLAFVMLMMVIKYRKKK